MNEEKFNLIKTIRLNLNRANAGQELVELLSELRYKGLNEVTIKIEASPENLLRKSGYDLRTFNKIKNRQELPDWVVYDLILSSGKLKESDFIKRALNAE